MAAGARLVLTNANLIDAITAGVTSSASVTIEDERIVEVLDGRRSPTTRAAQGSGLRRAGPPGVATDRAGRCPGVDRAVPRQRAACAPRGRGDRAAHGRHAALHRRGPQAGIRLWTARGPAPLHLWLVSHDHRRPRPRHGLRPAV